MFCLQWIDKYHLFTDLPALWRSRWDCGIWCEMYFIRMFSFLWEAENSKRIAWSCCCCCTQRSIPKIASWMVLISGFSKHHHKIFHFFKGSLSASGTLHLLVSIPQPLEVPTSHHVIYKPSPCVATLTYSTVTTNHISKPHYDREDWQRGVPTNESRNPCTWAGGRVGDLENSLVPPRARQKIMVWN